MSRRSEELKKRQMKKAVETAVDSYLAATAMMLKKEFGFGKERIQRALSSIESEVEGMGKGYIGLDDYLELVKERTGIEIKRTDEQNKNK